MKHSTPASRAAKRDFWTSPRVARYCRGLDIAAVYFLGTLIFLLGSIQPR